jgi:hypothetical protein
MKNLLNKDALQNMLNHVKTLCPELVDFVLQDADPRCGKRVALATIKDGAQYVKTDFMGYSEMNCFLIGYSFKAERRYEKSCRTTIGETVKQYVINHIAEMMTLYKEGESLLDGEMEMDCSISVESDDNLVHLCHEFFPNYVIVEIYPDGKSDAIDTYKFEYSKMELPLLREISKCLQEYFDRLNDDSDEI